MHGKNYVHCHVSAFVCVCVPVCDVNSLEIRVQLAAATTHATHMCRSLYVCVCVCLSGTLEARSLGTRDTHIYVRRLMTPTIPCRECRRRRRRRRRRR